MTDMQDHGDFPKQPGLGQQIVTFLPAIIISMVLGVGISYLLMNSANKKTQQQLEDYVAQKEEALNNSMAELEKARKALEKEVSTKIEKERQQRETTTAETKKSIADQFTLVSESLTAMTKDYAEFKGVSKVVDDQQSSELAKHEGNINALETRMRYIDNKLQKIDELAQDVNGLKAGQAGLKSEYVALRDDMANVKRKNEVTAQELADLDKRAQMFQLKVLAARAREAADAARQTDLKNLLNRLEDVEDK